MRRQIIRQDMVEGWLPAVPGVSVKLDELLEQKSTLPKQDFFAQNAFPQRVAPDRQETNFVGRYKHQCLVEFQSETCTVSTSSSGQLATCFRKQPQQPYR